MLTAAAIMAVQGVLVIVAMLVGMAMEHLRQSNERLRDVVSGGEA